MLARVSWQTACHRGGRQSRERSQGMDHEHELAEEWHRKDVSPETVLLVSLGALLLLGVCTQVVRQSTLPVVITLILMAIITMGSLMGLQSSLPATLSHGRPAYQSP